MIIANSTLKQVVGSTLPRLAALNGSLLHAKVLQWLLERTSALFEQKFEFDFYDSIRIVYCPFEYGE